ncbi:MAG TPA: hypothetical protein VIC71_02800 [Gammaproteobacteria bacterium]
MFGLPGAGGADNAGEAAGSSGDDAGGSIPGGGSAGGATAATGAAGAAQSGSADVADEPPATIEGCEDTDKVARQLCEAATEEKDPFLRAALWNEYNEYRRILARQ